MAPSKVIIVLALLALMATSSFCLPIKEKFLLLRTVRNDGSSSNNDGNCTNSSNTEMDISSENISGADNGDNGNCVDCEKQPRYCKTWAQDTFDILGHFLDNVMILIGEMEQCLDGQIVISMWGYDAPVPELNKYGKSCCKLSTDY